MTAAKTSTHNDIWRLISERALTKHQKHKNKRTPNLFFARFDAIESRFAASLSDVELAQLGQYFASHDYAGMPPVAGEYVSSTPFRHDVDYDIKRVCVGFGEDFGGSVLIAFNRGVPIGFIAYSTDDDDAVIYIEYLYVIPSARGHAYSKALVNHMLLSLHGVLMRCAHNEATIDYEVDNLIADSAIRSASNTFRQKLSKQFVFNIEAEF